MSEVSRLPSVSSWDTLVANKSLFVMEKRNTTFLHFIKLWFYYLWRFLRYANPKLLSLYQVLQKSNTENPLMLVSSKFVSSISVQCLSGISREPNGIVGYDTPKTRNIYKTFPIQWFNSHVGYRLNSLFDLS